MSKVLQRRTAMLAVIASLVFCTAALAQMPINPWKKAAPFPYPDEELYGVALNGKMYVIGGFVPPKDTQIPTGGAWEPIADTWEYDPAADSWKSLAPVPTKRGAAVAVEVAGKIYVIGGANTVAGSKDPD